MVASIVISVCASIISGMVLFFLQRYFKRKRKEDEERDKAKAKQNLLILKSINAVSNKEIEIEFECGITVRETL